MRISSSSAKGAFACFFVSLGLLLLLSSRAYAQPNPYLDEPSTDTSLAKKLAIEKGPTDVIFLRALASRDQAVVGEHITINIYLYYKIAYEMVERRDPPYSDFLRHPLLTDPSMTRAVYPTVNGERYGARLVEQVALVPRKVGKLNTGSMKASFIGDDLIGRVVRESNDLIIEVTEPPVDGRPANYDIGTVGDMKLSAVVTPRAVKQGGSIGVTAKIEGTGSFPPSLITPESKGVTWLDPTRKDNESIHGGKIGGSRVFVYVVRLESAGRIDLGVLSLPYFDPATRKYEVAKVELGTVDVEEVAPSEADLDRAKLAKGDKGIDPLSEIPEMRRDFPGQFEIKRKPPMSLGLFGLGLGLPPILALLVLGLGRAQVAVKERRAAPSTMLKKTRNSAAKEAKALDKAGDPRALGAALEKMLHSCIEAKAGIKSRAYQKDDIGRALAESGVARDLVNDVKQLLEDLELIRFAPTTDDSARAELSRRVREVVKKLES